MVPPPRTSAQIRVGVGDKTAIVDRFEGGNGMADVVTLRSGAAFPPDKKVDGVRFTEMAWELGLARASAGRGG